MILENSTEKNNIESIRIEFLPKVCILLIKKYALRTNKYATNYSILIWINNKDVFAEVLQL